MASQPLLIVENTKLWRYLHHAQFPGNRNARREPRPRCSPRRDRLPTPDKAARHEALGPCSQRERWIPHPPPTHYVLQMEAVHLSAQPGFASTSTEEQGIDCETTLLRSSAPRRTGLSNLAQGVEVLKSQEETRGPVRAKPDHFAWTHYRLMTASETRVVSFTSHLLLV